MAKVTGPDFSRFQKATDQIKPRLIACVAGEVGSGKSSFAFGAPGPIVVQTLDQGLEGVVEPYTKDKDIYIASYNTGTDGTEVTHAMAVELMQKFNEDFANALKIARTIVWDRESDVWDWHVYAETGSDDKFASAPPKDWPKIKAKLRGLISMAKASDVNLIVIKGLRNEWVSTVNPKTGNKTAMQTGMRIPSGMDEIEADVHTNILLERKDSGADKDAEFTMRVGKTRGPGARDVQGKVFTPALSFTE
jgi:hypothetical protein